MTMNNDNVNLEENTGTNTETETVENPVDEMEKTIEDLKKKIDELDQPAEEKEEEVKFDIPDFSSFDTPDSSKKPEQASAMLDEVKEAAEKSFNAVKDKAEDFVESNPNAKKTVDYLKANAKKAFETAKDKVDDLSAKPEVQQGFEKAKELGSNAMKKVDGILSEENKEALAKGISKAGDTLVTGAKAAKDAVEDFMAKPEVQQGLERAKDEAKDLAAKGGKALTNLFNSLKNRK